MLPPTNPPATLRPQREIEEQLWLLLAQLPYAEEEHEDRDCAYLTALIFALGTDWTDARLAALKLWGERKPPAAPADPQCALCGSWNVDEDEDHESPGSYYRCRNCGDTWVEHDALANAELLTQLAKVMNDRPLAVVQCDRCAGCGQIADSEDGEPWKYWMDLPVRSSQAVILGLVKPLPCPKCGGTGGKPLLNGLTASLGPGPGRDG